MKVSLQQKVIDLTGQTFGLLSVIERGDNDRRGNAWWKCLCDCGTVKMMRGVSLRSGHTKSCGCYHKQQASQQSKINLTGQRFTRLLVVQDSGLRQARGVMWECLCDCGVVKNISSQALIKHRTQSCGCLNRENASRIFTTHGQSYTRGYRLDLTAKRRAGKLQRTPKWADTNRTAEIYRLCPDGYEVDHIIPLQGKLVSGLHVPDNLQYLSVNANRAKHNNFNPIII